MSRPDPNNRIGIALTVVAHPKPADGDVFPVSDHYPDTFWTPLLGPTAMLAARRLDLLLDDWDRLDLDVDDFGEHLGVSGDVIRRGLRRLTMFRVADLSLDGQTLQMRRRWPMLTERHIDRLPKSLHTYHDGFVATPCAEVPA